MKFYVINDRQLHEIAHVIGRNRRPLLEFIRNLIRELQALVEDIAELRKEPSTNGGDDAPPIAPRD